MPEQTPQQQALTAVKEFQDIRNVLWVPFREDLKDLVPVPPDRPGELPLGRQWRGPCLGYPPISEGTTTAPPIEKPKAEKKTQP